MLFTLKDIQDRRLNAVDGDLGEMKTVLIDADAWVVRYLVAEVGNRNVLLSAASLEVPVSGESVLYVNSSKEKIINSPAFDANQPVSRAIERRFSDYFEWPYYWELDVVPNTLPGDLTAVPLVEMQLDHEKKIEEQDLIPETGSNTTDETQVAPLYSTDDLFGSTIHTITDDKNAGKLVDFVIQKEDWSILYLVADTGGVLPGKKVLITPSWVKRIAENGSRIDIDLKQETIIESPEFHAVSDLTDDFQDQLEE